MTDVRNSIFLNLATVLDSFYAIYSYLGGVLPYMANIFRGCAAWTERCQSTEYRHTRHKRAIIKRHFIFLNRNIHSYIIQVRTPGKLTKCITKNYKERWIYYKLRQVLQSVMINTNCDSTTTVLGGFDPGLR